MLAQTIGFIGAGQMARALAQGLLQAALVKPNQIVAADALPAAAAEFARLAEGSQIANTNRDVAERSQILFLAVKPQQIAQVLADLGPVVGDQHLLVSIAAGVRLESLSAGLGGRGRLVRVMPNTPCLVRESASAFALGPRATAADGELVHQILSAVGQAHQLDEKSLDAVTGLSGSGPAFIYVLIEALADGGVRMGLPRTVATALAAQTVKGAAAMVLSSGEHPAVLKDRVASPGGTTIAGLQALESGGFRAALINAVEAATRRSLELGKM